MAVVPEEYLDNKLNEELAEKFQEAVVGPSKYLLTVTIPSLPDPIWRGEPSSSPKQTSKQKPG